MEKLYGMRSIYRGWGTVMLARVLFVVRETYYMEWRDMIKVTKK